MIITADHMHSVPTWNGRQGYCHSKAREFFARHGLDWFGFLKNGIDSETLLATGDALAVYLVEHVEAQQYGQQ